MPKYRIVKQYNPEELARYRLYYAIEEGGLFGWSYIRGYFSSVEEAEEYYEKVLSPRAEDRVVKVLS